MEEEERHHQGGGGEGEGEGEQRGQQGEGEQRDTSLTFSPLGKNYCWQRPHEKNIVITTTEQELHTEYV